VCGIAGIVHLDGRPVDDADIKRMTDALAHRGPDGEGQWCEGSVGLGHRRLAIIDLSEEASQPMHSLDKRFVITYNGEVYNFKELRRELELGGSRFHSRSDSEVVLEAISTWGVDDALRRFNGMFALAIWDRHHKLLHLARDRYGIKPLYVYENGDIFAFASEPKALRALNRVSEDVDPYSLAEYLTFQDIYSHRTLTKNIRAFPAAHRVTIALEGNRRPTPRAFWSWPVHRDQGTLAGSTTQDIAEEIQRLFTQAVHRQVVSDVPIGAFLSGGIDSSAIAQDAVSLVPDLRTFTVGFDLENVAASERHFDERHTARRVSRTLGTLHHEVKVQSNDVLGALDAIAFHQDEPRAGQSYPNRFAAQLAGRTTRVVLGGTGGDELFAGYPWRLPGTSLDLATATKVHFEQVNRVFPLPVLKRVLAPVWHEISDFDPRELHGRIFQAGWDPDDDANAPIHAALNFDLRKFLPALLAVDDRQGMAFGVEARAPFLDNDLVDFVSLLPAGDLAPNIYFGDSGPGGQRSDGKTLLRFALRSRLPNFVLDAPKQGFAAPDTLWWRTDLRSAVRERIVATPLSVLDSSYLLRLWDEEHFPRTRAQSWSIAIAVASLGCLF
jgi:asparagine synthase (glutamine-hydrolysing)